jgi:LPS-assembly protein
VPDGATVERPDFSVKIPRPAAPVPGDYDITADAQESEGGVYHLHGHVVVELSNATFKADEAEYDEDTKIFKAHGNVSYRNYDHNEVIYCDRAEYNTDTARGTFHHVRGYTKTKVQARPGILATQEPFYFEGEWAERLEDKYLLHDGLITDCHIPHPWWTLHGSLFDIIPDDRAITHNGILHIRAIPMFYFPYFYKGLKKEPRKSGFLMPNIGTSAQRGYMLGTGYYWAINRSYDLTYMVQDFTARGFAHHLDLRGKPNQKSDFDLIFFGVNDRGYQQGGSVYKAPGVSLTGMAKTEFGNGWVARASINYLSSLKFRQSFTDSYSEAIFSEAHSSAFVMKNFDYYSFNTIFSRTENFQSAIAGDSVVIRKLPEFNFLGRDQQIADGPLPAWFSFQTSFGLYHRAQPRPEGLPVTNFYETSQFSARGDFAPSVTTAFQWKGFSLVPSFTMHETIYGQSFVNNAVTNTRLNRNAPEISIDLALPPIARVFERKTFLGDKLKHVVEPRVTYDYVNGVNSFGNTLRFDENDLLSNTNELELGITNRLYSKRGDRVTELLTWEVYQKRFFDPTFGGVVVDGQRNVVLSTIGLTGYSFLDGARNYSPVVSVLRTSPRPGLGIQWEADYDPRRRTNADGSIVHPGLANSAFSADVRFKKYFVTAGHNLVRATANSPAANQLISTLGYGNTNRKGWNTAFSSVYDIRQGITQYAIAQVTYNTDCCGWSVEYRRFAFGARNDNQYRIAFSIANIGTFGNLKKQERLF